MFNYGRSLMTMHVCLTFILLGFLIIKPFESKKTSAPTLGRLVYKYGMRLKTWRRAQKRCKRWGGHLATVSSSDQNSYLYKQMLSRNLYAVWIGLSDQDARNDTFLWADPHFKGIVYRNWNYRQPDRSLRESCVIIISPGVWSAVSCASKRAFICQKRAKVTTETTRTTATTATAPTTTTSTTALTTTISTGLSDTVRFPSPIRGQENGRPYIQGHVEILHNNRWGTICDDDFDSNDAKVICRMAGHKDGAYIKELKQPRVTKAAKIWLSNAACTGIEKNIDACPSRIWDPGFCTHYADVGIRCYMSEKIPPTSQGAYKCLFVSGDGYGEGEINIKGVQTEDDCIKACVDRKRTNQNINGVTVYSNNNRRGCWCELNMNTVFPSYRFKTCFLFNYGGEGQIRFPNPQRGSVNGNSYVQGVVEILHNGVFFGMCDDMFDDKDISVICRMGGYQEGDYHRRYKQRSVSVYATIRFVNLQCSGKELHIRDCKYGGWGKQNCLHSEVLAIRCYKGDQMRFPDPIYGEANGKSFIQGHVEIRHDGIWGTICDKGFGDYTANVLCKMGGYGYGKYNYSYKQTSVKKSIKIWLTNLVCYGTESHIRNCSHSDWAGWSVKRCNHRQDVGIRCYAEVAETPSSSSFDLTSCIVGIVGAILFIVIIGFCKRYRCPSQTSHPVSYHADDQQVDVEERPPLMSDDAMDSHISQILNDIHDNNISNSESEAPIEFDEEGHELPQDSILTEISDGPPRYRSIFPPGHTPVTSDEGLPPPTYEDAIS